MDAAILNHYSYLFLHLFCPCSNNIQFRFQSPLFLHSSLSFVSHGFTRNLQFFCNLQLLLQGICQALHVSSETKQNKTSNTYKYNSENTKRKANLLRMSFYCFCNSKTCLFTIITNENFKINNGLNDLYRRRENGLRTISKIA